MQVATPEPSSGCASQPLTPPPEKSTVPVGLVPSVTVAVKVTLWPNVEGLDEDCRVVVVEDDAKAGVPTSEDPAAEHQEKCRHHGHPQAPGSGHQLSATLALSPHHYPDLGGHRSAQQSDRRPDGIGLSGPPRAAPLPAGGRTLMTPVATEPVSSMAMAIYEIDGSAPSDRPYRLYPPRCRGHRRRDHRSRVDGLARGDPAG